MLDLVTIASFIPFGVMEVGVDFKHCPFVSPMSFEKSVLVVTFAIPVAINFGLYKSACCEITGK